MMEGFYCKKVEDFRFAGMTKAVFGVILTNYDKNVNHIITYHTEKERPPCKFRFLT